VIKGLIILLLAVAVFGSGIYWTYELYFRPKRELLREKTLPPPPPPVDPSLADFDACLELKKEGRWEEARQALEFFMERYPQSSKADAARQALGEINGLLFLSPERWPEKQEYSVKKGDVLNKVAASLRCSPELLMRANKLSGVTLRIGQRLVVPTGDFSLVLSPRSKRVTILNRGRYFKQYIIRSQISRKTNGAGNGAKESKQPLAAASLRLTGKVSDKMAWAATGKRLSYADPDYQEAFHWIVLSVGNHTLYSEPGPDIKPQPPRPPSGLGLDPESVEELAALLRKGDPVTIEQ
jgi:LysM repeat protein